jgi:polyphosphate kinase 2 (PPK2 family)
MDYRKQFVVDPGHRLCLKDIDPAYKGHHETHETAAAELEHYRQKLGQMQTLLYAERKHGILIVLQALDAGGKDGTVNHVFAA